MNADRDESINRKQPPGAARARKAARRARDFGERKQNRGRIRQSLLTCDRALTIDSSQPIPAVWLTSPVRQPLVFSKRIDRIDDGVGPGDLVAVYAPMPGAGDAPPVTRIIGYGIYNSRATISLRIIRFSEDLPDNAFWDRLAESAVSLRHDTLDLTRDTNACRMIHAEADGFPGLVVDRYDDVLSAEAFSLGMFQRSRAILDRLQSRCGTRHQVVRTSPHSLAQEGFDTAPWFSEDCPPSVDINEYGTRFRIRLDGETHKTGFFCDQRENRKKLADFCRDKSVLDLCCYSGGFSIQAKKMGQAADVTGVDLDEHPLAVARENANLNQCRVKWVQADVFPYMRDMIRGGRMFDVVVLDPPKLIRSRAEIEEGTRKHLDLNKLAMQLVKPGGILLSCTCAGLLPAEEFEKVIHTAARWASVPDSAGGNSSLSGRKVRIIATSGAASDHPVAADSPETRYLHAVWMRIDDHC